MQSTLMCFVSFILGEPEESYFMETIPLVDLKAQYLTIKEEVLSAIQSVLERSSFILGDEVEQFEREFARSCQTSFAVGVANGTDALSLSLKALGIGPGDEVITVPNTAFATAEAILHAGAEPQFVDVDPVTFTMDPEALKKKISPKTRAVIPVHFLGQPADMDRILEIARSHDLKVIEDAAQSHGACYKGQKVGTLGDAGAFSFHPTKILGAYGDGGIIVTNDKELADRLKVMRNHGCIGEYIFENHGCNSRLDALQAAVLSVKLKYLSQWKEKRDQNARLYYQHLEGFPGITLPQNGEDVVPSYFVFPILLGKRDELREHLRAKGIGAAVHYPVPIHKQPAFSQSGLQNASFPVSEEMSRTILSLPVYPELTPADIEIIANSVKACLSEMALA